MLPGGSTSIPGLWQVLRELAASMREMIKAEAATLLGADISTLKVKDGVISVTDKSMTYGEVVQQVKEWKEPSETPKLKDPKDYKYIGKPIPRVDLEEKVMGDPIFGLDAEMEGMLYGSCRKTASGGCYFCKCKD